MATAPRVRPKSPEDAERGIKVFNPIDKASNSVLIKLKDEPRRNPADAIKRFKEEKSYGLGRRRKTRRIRKSKKTRKY